MVRLPVGAAAGTNAAAVNLPQHPGQVRDVVMMGRRPDQPYAGKRPAAVDGSGEERDVGDLFDLGLWGFLAEAEQPRKAHVRRVDRGLQVGPGVSFY